MTKWPTMCILFALTGCGTTRWSHPNFSEYSFRQDAAICDYEAQNVTARPTQPYNPYLNPTQQANQSFANAGASFAQAFAAQSYLENCMLRKGYFPVK